MSVALPFVLVLLAGAFAAYHRLRLAIWVATSAALLIACWLFGANHVAVGIAAALIALVALPLLLPGVRKRWITAPLLGFYTSILPPLSDTERTALEVGHGRLRRRAVLRQARLGPAAVAAEAGAHRRGAGLPRRPVRRRCAG